MSLSATHICIWYENVFSQVSAEQKSVGSTSGMHTSVKTSELLKVQMFNHFCLSLLGVYFNNITESRVLLFCISVRVISCPDFLTASRKKTASGCWLTYFFVPCCQLLSVFLFHQRKIPLFCYWMNQWACPNTHFVFLATLECACDMK